jgi:hypothetical protein
MKALKIIGIAFGGLASFAGGIFALALMLTSGATQAAEDFVKLVGESRYEQAYRDTAPQLKVVTTLETFQKVIQQVGLDKAKTVSWTSRTRENDSATIEGTIRTRDGRTIAVTIRLVKIEGTWRVMGLDAQPSGAS